MSDFQSSLHTDFLKRFYSEINVETESQSDILRKAHLVDGDGISRTYAITHFHSNGWTDEVAEVAAEIMQNKSIGEMFRNHGFVIHKKPICTIAVSLSGDLMKRFATTRSEAILHQYVFAVTKDGSDLVDFATITEIYPPELSDIFIRKQLLQLTRYPAPYYINDIKKEIGL